MCWRTEGKTIVCKAVLLWTAFFSCTGAAAALPQDLPGDIVRLIERQCEDGGGDPEALLEYFQELARKPLNLNTADREALEGFPLMTPFMVSSLLEYRSEYGAVASAGELAMVDGFDIAAVRRMLPFVTLGAGPEGNTGSADEKLRVSGKLTLRSRMDLERGDEEEEGLPVPLYAKYRMEVGRHLSAGFTLESDRGEKDFPDFYSFNIGVSDLRLSGDGRCRLESAVVGDFSLRFGQGLVLWNSFSLSGLSSPSAAMRRGGGIVPYTSSNENRYFHGAGVTLGFPEGVRASVFYSDNGQDARIEGDCFTTKPEDGVHDTEALRAARDAMREKVLGANVSWSGEWLRTGVTAAAYRYSHLDGRRKSYYNEHLRYDGWWGNVSLDWLMSFRGLLVFGEAALDREGAFAGIAGAVYSFAMPLEASVLYRYYSPRYIATHAGAYCRSNVNNEHGVSAAVKWSPGGSVDVSSSLEYTYFPYARYGVRDPSSCLKGVLECSWTVADNHSVYARVSGTYDNGRDTRQLRLRLGYEYGGETGFGAVSRIEGGYAGGSLGMLMYQEGRYKSASGKFRVGLRLTFFSTDSWDSRIYCYEGGIPGTFSVPAYYGKGTGLNAVAAYKPVRWLNVHFRCSLVKYFSDPDKDCVDVGLQLTLPF